MVTETTHKNTNKMIYFTIDTSVYADSLQEMTYRRIWIPQVIASLMLLWALYPDNPYAYYTLLRVVCCGVFAYLAVQAHKQQNSDWVWILGSIAVLYNPIATIHLTREIWSIVNVVTIIVAGISVVVLRRSGS